MYDIGNHSLVLFDRGDEIVVQAGPEGIRFLLVSGKPIEEPVAWHGPIVMNTQTELRQAMYRAAATGRLSGRECSSDWMGTLLMRATIRSSGLRPIVSTSVLFSAKCERNRSGGAYQSTAADS